MDGLQNYQSHVESLRANRWENFSLNAKEREERRVTLDSLPPSVMLPTGRRCNLRCQMCIDRSDPTLFKDLTLDDFIKFAPELEFASSIAIYGWGEPFMNPDYDRILDYIAEYYPGVIIHISTNGTLLKSHRRKKLLGMPNLFLNVSVNAATKKTYNEIMGLDLFDVVTKNISALIEEKKNLGSQFPVVTMSFVLMRQNYAEIKLFYELAKEIGVDDILISDLMELEEDHIPLTVDDFESDVLGSYLRAKSIETPEDGPTLTQFSDMPYLPAEQKNVCVDPWESFKVGDDGGVSICCYANRTFGNVFQQSIAEIWNSDDVKHYRETVNTDHPPPPCRKCPKKRGLFR